MFRLVMTTPRVVISNLNTMSCSHFVLGLVLACIRNHGSSGAAARENVAAQEKLDQLSKKPYTKQTLRLKLFNCLLFRITRTRY
jgi:hypothetical protein